MDSLGILFDVPTLIRTAGYLGIFGIVFVESGLLIGFFLPGDSLLFTAGFLASQGYLHIGLLVIGSFVAAVAGDSVGYAIGYRFGSQIFARDGSFFFRKEHLVRAENFYATYGGKTVVIARFMPVVRAFVPVLAGVAKMHYRTFLFYNILGGFLWAVGLSLLGFFLGSTIPNIDHYLLPIIAIIIVVSALPGIISIMRNREIRRQMVESVKMLIKRKNC